MFVSYDVRTVGRTPNEHVASGGGGTHYRLGAHLARLEIRAMFEEVLARLHGIELDGPIEWLPSMFSNGPRRMPSASACVDPRAGCFSLTKSSDTR
jgi:cytochrome P450